MNTLYPQPIDGERANVDEITVKSNPAEWCIEELQARAGALVRDALKSWPAHVKKAHWADMQQTAMLAFLEHADKGMNYAYAVAKSALKNYKWVHIRGLNGGWKSLACQEQGYQVIDLGIDEDESLEARLDREVARSWDVAPRPVEWAVERRLAPPDMTDEEALRRMLIILAGMGDKYLPEHLYRAALIFTLLGRGYTWEHVEAITELTYAEVFDIYWGWRRRHLNPYLELTPIHQELVKLRGRMRIAFFKELDHDFLNTAIRKMIVFPHGIYTITYKRRGRNAGRRAGELEASLQKGRKLNGRNYMRAVHLGKLGEVTKERLYDASFKVEQKLAAVAAS